MLTVASTSCSGGRTTSTAAVPTALLLSQGCFWCPCPAASSKSERVFSVAGNIVTPKKASLNPEKAEQLIVIKCNMQLLRQFGRKIV